MITNSVEWSKLESELIGKTHRLKNNHDIRRMIKNLNVKITDLSKAEVEARRGRSHRSDQLLKEINDDIQLVEEFLLIAKLIG